MAISGNLLVRVFTVDSSASLTLQNLTVENGSISGSGGGIDNGGTLTITNSTLSGNSAGAGGGILNEGGATLTITNSIVANTPLGGDCINGGTFTFTANGNNLDTDGSCPSVGQVTSAQLNLGPLFFNGGPTRTHALLSGSFAIDAGVQSLCAADSITTDQRGVLRDALCDIGSFEFVPPPPPPPQADLSIAKSAAKTAQTGKGLTYTITVKNNGPDSAADVLVNDVLPAGTSFVSLTPSAGCLTPAVGFTGTVSCSYASLASGASLGDIKIVVKVTAKGNAQLNNTATVSSTTFDPNPANNSATATSKLGK